MPSVHAKTNHRAIHTVCMHVCLSSQSVQSVFMMVIPMMWKTLRKELIMQTGTQTNQTSIKHRNKVGTPGPKFLEGRKVTERRQTGSEATTGEQAK